MNITQTIESQYPVINKVQKDIPFVVVLSGGQAYQKGLPANSLLYSASLKRLVEAVRLFRQLPNAKLLLSGGGYGGDEAESSHLKDVAKWFDIPENRILIETNSINTADQAKEVKAMVGEKPFYLVTSAIHMSRSMALFEKQGLNPIAAPTDFTVYWQDERWQKIWIPNAHNMVYLQIALHEKLGMAWAWLNDQI